MLPMRAMTITAESFNAATYISNMMLTSTLEGRTLYEMVYDMKLGLADLRAFSAPCAIIVKPSEKLKTLDDWAIACVFVRYKCKYIHYL